MRNAPRQSVAEHPAQCACKSRSGFETVIVYVCLGSLVLLMFGALAIIIIGLLAGTVEGGAAGILGSGSLVPFAAIFRQILLQAINPTDATIHVVIS